MKGPPYVVDVYCPVVDLSVVRCCGRWMVVVVVVVVAVVAGLPPVCTVNVV